MIVEWKGNKRIGLWEVQNSYRITPKNERKWLCRCECGTERYVLERSLRSGGSKSCGCESRRRAREANEHALIGQTFGELKVHAKAAKRGRNGGTWWQCVCSCGNTFEVPGTLLVTARKTHCGCKTQPKKYYYRDISGKQFGRLTAISPTDERDPKGSVIWSCKCTCGNLVNIPYNWLEYGNIQSCGCQKNEHERNLGRYLTHIGGTSIDLIKSKKLPSDNTTGVKGVYFIKGKYHAKIVFQHKQYQLGRYSTVEEAARARRAAEEVLFDGSAAHYARWKEKADADPDWAQKNPIEILVSKQSTGELKIIFLPVISEPCSI